MKRTTNVVVKQLEEAPVQVEVLADAIVAISRAAQKLSSAGLSQRALICLLYDMIPAPSPCKRDIKAVLDALPKLEAQFITKKRNG